MERALNDALVCWRASRCEHLAQNIDQLTDHLLISRPVRATEHWNELARRRRVEDLPALLSTLPNARDERFGTCLDALRGFDPDPRIAQTLRHVLEAEELLAHPSHRTTWRRVFATLASVGDPRTRAWLPLLVDSQRAGTPASRRWLITETNALCGVLPRPRASVVRKVVLPGRPSVARVDER